MTETINAEPPKYEWQSPKPQFDVGRVLGNAFKGLFANKPALVAAFAVAFVVSLISAIVTNYLVNVPLSRDPSGLGAGYFGGLAVTYILTILTTVWFQLVVVQAAYHSLVGESVSVQRLLMRALKLCIPMAFLAILYSVVCILGFYALLIGFVFVWPGWALLGPVFLFEDDTSYFGSFGRAWRLAKGYKRWILLVLVILMIISIILYTIAFGIAGAAFGLNALDPNTTAALTQISWQAILFTVISSVAGFFIYGIYATAITASYVEIKTLKGEMGATLAAVFD